MSLDLTLVKRIQQGFKTKKGVPHLCFCSNEKMPFPSASSAASMPMSSTGISQCLSVPS